MVTTSRRDFAALEGRRLRAARLFAQGQTQGAVARALGVTTAAVNHWHQMWRAKGVRGLKAAGRAGRKPKLDARQLVKVHRALRAGPGRHGFSTELWTLPRVATVIQRLTGVRHHPSHVGRLLQQLDWSLQRPGRRARERDEAAIARWRTGRGPHRSAASCRRRTMSIFWPPEPILPLQRALVVNSPMTLETRANTLARSID